MEILREPSSYKLIFNDGDAFNGILHRRKKYSGRLYGCSEGEIMRVANEGEDGSVIGSYINFDHVGLLLAKYYTIMKIINQY